MAQRRFSLSLLVLFMGMDIRAGPANSGLQRSALEEARLRPSTIHGVLLRRVLFHPSFAR